MNVHANILNMRKIINLYYEMIERRLNPTINIHKLCLKAAIQDRDLTTCQYILQQIKYDYKIKFDMKCWQLVLSFIQKEINRYNNNNNQQKDDINHHNHDANEDNNLNYNKINEYYEYEIILKNEMMKYNKNNKYYSSA